MLVIYPGGKAACLVHILHFVNYAPFFPPTNCLPHQYEFEYDMDHVTKLIKLNLIYKYPLFQ